MASRISPDPFLVREPKETIDRMKRFLRTHRERTGASTLIVGMSGGLDSSVTATLCALAVNGRNVLGICMPEKETWNQKNIEDAKNVAKRSGIRFKLIDTTKIVEASRDSIPLAETEKSRIPYGNIKARLRAMALYYFANSTNGLVVGTGDKSEIMIGYFTKYGDGACDIQPLADVYKTSVRDLARHLSLPERIYTKPASPELWPGQTAQNELGVGYDKLDPVLWGLERWMEIGEIASETGLSVNLVRRIRDRWIRSEHKRRPPLALKLGYRTAGYDLRLPYTVAQAAHRKLVLD